MSREFVLMISLGFFLFIIGGLARTYMNFRLNGHLWRGQGGQSTERKYSRLIKGRNAPVLPLVMAVTLMPLGIAMVFGTIIWHNRHRQPQSTVVRPK
jgi:NADH:ubiquinone oxidoreductase subunit 5 (subunit L)/multisubunit Na+/H+ antiporter MnhA subunit